jgi:hypothetical protein
VGRAFRHRDGVHHVSSIAVRLAKCTESFETLVSVSVEARLSQTQRDPRNPQRFALGSRPHPVPRGTSRG